jgi:hypothetical protein
MVLFARRRAMRNIKLWLLGTFVWVVSFFLAAIFVGEHAGRDKPIPEAVPWVLLGVSVLGILFGPAYFFGQLYRRLFYNPNRIWR